MVAIVLRSSLPAEGPGLTSDQIDGNFQALNDGKMENGAGAVIGKQDTGWPAINAPTLRVVDDLNGTNGGLSIESYQPMLQLLDRDAGQANVRLRLTGGVLNYEYNDGSDSGAYSLGSSTRLNGGNVGIGGVYNPGAALHVRTKFGALTTTTEQSGAEISTEFNESATLAGYGLRVAPAVKNVDFQMASLYGVLAAAPSIGAAAKVSSYDAFCADNPPGLTGDSPRTAAVRMRFHGTASTNRWNLYGDGTAPNYLNGTLYLGSTVDDGSYARLQVLGDVSVRGKGIFDNVTVGSISTAGWGRKNYCRNEAMAVFQRSGWAGIGTSYTPPVNTQQYLVDGWCANQSGATSAHTLSRVQALDSQNRMRYWNCVTVGTARGSYSASGYDAPFIYTSEAVETADLYNKPFTISFECQGSVAGTYSVAVRCFDGAGAITGSIVKTFYMATANTPKRYALSFPATTLMNSVASNLKHFDVWIGCVAGSSFRAPSGDAWLSGSSANYLSMNGPVGWYSFTGATLMITAVKIEEGTNDTPIVPKAFSDVLKECRRTLEFGRQTHFFLVSASGSPTTYMYDTIPFKEDKRTSTVVVGLWNWAYYNVGGGAVSQNPALLGTTDKDFTFGYQAVANLAGWPNQGQWLASAEF